MAFGSFVCYVCVSFDSQFGFLPIGLHLMKTNSVHICIQHSCAYRKERQTILLILFIICFYLFPATKLLLCFRHPFAPIYACPLYTIQTIKSCYDYGSHSVTVCVFDVGTIFIVRPSTWIICVLEMFCLDANKFVNVCVCLKILFSGSRSPVHLCEWRTFNDVIYNKCFGYSVEKFLFLFLFLIFLFLFYEIQ